MFNEKTKNWIASSVKGRYSANKCNQAIEALDLFLEVSATGAQFRRCIERTCDGGETERLDQLRDFTDIETFMKSLYRVTDRRAYFEKINNNDDMTLKDLYKEIFEVIPPEVNLKTASPEGFTGIRREYIGLYQFRNKDIHERDLLKLTGLDVYHHIIQMLCCELDLCESHREKIREEYDKARLAEAFDLKQYLKSVKDAYKAEIDPRFHYVNFHWMSNGDDNGYDADSILELEGPVWMKLLGEAGTGKTTLLKELMYLLTQKKGAGRVPVFLELKNLTMSNHILLDAAARRLGTTEEFTKMILAGESVWLLLDGFNEILDSAVKKKLAFEIDRLCRTYSGVSILLTDRAVIRQVVPVLPKATELFLVPMNNELKQEYFEKNCPDEETKRLILTALGDTPELFDRITTPLKMKRFAEIVEMTGEIPDDYLESYLAYLFDRELNDKKDENIQYLGDFLKGIACRMGNETDTLSVVQTKAAIAAVKNALGYSVPDSAICLNLALDMGILTQEDGVISFQDDEYKLYYQIEGETDGFDEFVPVGTVQQDPGETSVPAQSTEGTSDAGGASSE